MVNAKSQSHESKEVFVEDEVLAMPGLDKIAPPAQFARFIKEIAMKFCLSRPFQLALGEFQDNEMRVLQFADCFRKYPEDSEKFVALVKSIRKVEDELEIEPAIRMFGTDQTLDLLIAIELTNIVESRPFEWESDGLKPKIAPEELIVYAKKAQGIVGEDSPYYHVAYGSGLIFDMLKMTINIIECDKPKVLSLLDIVFMDGLRAARIATAFAADIEHLEHVNYLFGACIVHNIGKVLLPILYPNYFDFLEAMNKAKLVRSLRFLAEKAFFKTSHSLLGYLICHYFELMRPIKDAVLYHHDPYLLKNEEKQDIYNLTLLVALSTNVANHWKKAYRTDDAVVDDWNRPELKDLNMKTDYLVKVINSVIAKYENADQSG